ncbi:MAG TPA: DNA gyrase inhibitor YacG [Acetobacteraceae bacterium]|nr:DNA gyrase inhibitor YacG [Acetobacteraceae bacterium]
MNETVAPKPACPICGRPAAEGLRPFCSQRCAEVDLGRWLTGVYRIPAAPDDGDSEATDQP